MPDSFFGFGIRTYADSERPYRHRVRCSELAPSGHEYLFRFLSYDLMPFRSLVEAFTDELISRKTECEAILNELDRLYLAAEGIHPLFKNKDDARNLIMRSTIEYARSIRRLPEVSGTLIKALGLHPFSREMHDRLEEAGSTKHPKKGSVFSLLDEQERIRRAVTLLLDESVIILSPMTREGREAVYAAFFEHGERSEEMTVTIGMSLSPSHKAKNLQGRAGISPRNSKEAADILGGIRAGDDRPQWTFVLDDVQDETVPSVILTYKVRTLEDIFDTELFDMLRDGVRVGRCKTCGRFFTFDPENTEYCTIEEDGQNCLRTYREGVTKEMYLKAYKTHNQRLSRKRCSRKEFQNWKAEASAAREAVLERHISMKEYQEILKK